MEFLVEMGIMEGDDQVPAIRADIKTANKLASGVLKKRFEDVWKIAVIEKLA